MDLGIWLPVFGGWLRNDPQEPGDASFDYSRRVAQAADRLGFATMLVAELNLNDIKGEASDSLEAWTTAAALAPITERIRIMAALRPGFRQPAVAAKMAANIDHISGGRFEINLVSAWWKEEMAMYAGQWLDHEQRYERSEEFVRLMKALWTGERVDFEGDFYTAENAVLAPAAEVPVYAGGSSEAGRAMIAMHCDHYLMHGSTVEEVADNVADMTRRRRADQAPMRFGMAAFMVCRPTEAEARKEVERIQAGPTDTAAHATYDTFTKNSKLAAPVTKKDYAVSNRGLMPGLVGTPQQIAGRLAEYERAGLDLVLVQASPMLEETERIGREVLPLLKSTASSSTTQN